MFETTIAQKQTASTVFIKYFSMFPEIPVYSRSVLDLGTGRGLIFTKWSMKPYATLQAQMSEDEEYQGKHWSFRNARALHDDLYQVEMIVPGQLMGGDGHGSLGKYSGQNGKIGKSNPAIWLWTAPRY